MVKQGDLRAFLRTHLEHESAHYFGVTDTRYIDSVTDAWLNDETNSQRLYEDIARFAGGEIPKSARILDMASGCGTFVYYGLRHNLDVWGIDPEEWKHTFNRMKAYLQSVWLDEKLPGSIRPNRGAGEPEFESDLSD